MENVEKRTIKLIGDARNSDTELEILKVHMAVLEGLVSDVIEADPRPYLGIRVAVGRT